MSLRSFARTGGSVSVLNFTECGSALSLRGFARYGSGMSIYGKTRTTGSLSTLGFCALGKSDFANVIVFGLLSILCMGIIIIIIYGRFLL